MYSSCTAKPAKMKATVGYVTSKIRYLPDTLQVRYVTPGRPAGFVTCRATY